MLTSKFPIWWKPEKVAYYEGNSWKTVTNYQPSIFCKDTIAVSPIDENGKAHFIAFDVDTVRVKPIKHLLKVFPVNVKPLISA